MKKTSVALMATILSASAVFPAFAAENANEAETPKIILHAWSWSFDTIAANMADIARAGYTHVQTSPANTCLVGEGGGLALFSEPGDSVQGKWYYHYQPIDWQVGNYQLGDRNAFKALGDSALKYNVKIIVDVLPNHTAMDHTAVLPALDNAVGGHENLYHANGFTPITHWNDRYECTTGQMGGLPDVNTENPDFQHYFLQYLNDLINLGARGFRYDTAKHIGLPTDPLDARSERNNFWDVVTGRESVKGLSLFQPEELFIYGEVLQDRNVKETEYSEYISQTASSYGHALREVLEAGNYNAADLSDWHHPVSPDLLVTWVESHDTYCNAHESAGISDDVIRTGWVFLTAREAGTPLFYSRPAGSTRENYWGNNRIGARGNDEFFHPEVVAVNKFRMAMAGKPENVTSGNDGQTIAVSRGEDGVALINLADKNLNAEIKVSLPNGEYTDALYNRTFKVKNGVLKGKVSPNTTYILYAVSE